MANVAGNTKEPGGFEALEQTNNQRTSTDGHALQSKSLPHQ